MNLSKLIALIILGIGLWLVPVGCGGTTPAPQTPSVWNGEPTDQDQDNDRIYGASDRCPNEPEDRDGFEDPDGCPDPDNDKDGITDTADHCPYEAEDRDGFDDEDGCPDPDEYPAASGRSPLNLARAKADSTAMLERAVRREVIMQKIRAALFAMDDDLLYRVSEELTRRPGKITPEQPPAP